MSGAHSEPRTAAEWIARLNSDGRTDEDDRAFHAWLSADAAHGAAFERATDIWTMVPATDIAPVAPRAPILSRRRMLAGFAGTLAAGGGVLAMQTAYAGTRYSTGIGEQRRVTLAEGSSLLLDTDTQVRVRLDPDRRRLWLNRGRVALLVRPAPAPFAVEAGRGSFMAGRGRFDLRRDEDRVAMTALAGKAEVALGGVQRMLEAGERLRSDIGNGVRIDRPDAQATQAWESGRAAFRDDRLDAVAAEANRYSHIRLVIADPRTAALRVSGMYRMGDTPALAQALSQLLSVPVRRVDDAVVLGG